MDLRKPTAILIFLLLPAVLSLDGMASPASEAGDCDATVIEVVTAGEGKGRIAPSVDVYVGPIDQLDLAVGNTFSVFRPDEVNDAPIRHYPLMLYVGRIQVIDIQDEVAVCRTIEIVSDEQHPRVRHATVMIGDCVRLEVEESVEEPLTVAPEALPAEMLDVEGLKFSGTETPEPSRIIPTKVLFQFDSSVVQDKYAPDLAQLAGYIASEKPARVVIQGHACRIGTDEYNVKLSERRARAIVDYLVTRHGIDRDLFEVEAYGESRPEASNETEAGRIKNRRAATALFFEAVPTTRSSAASPGWQLAVDPEDLTPDGGEIPILPFAPAEVEDFDNL
jgi:outer membrane protein OmpA-like peptidoglycan-associated protein